MNEARNEDSFGFSLKESFLQDKSCSFHFKSKYEKLLTFVLLLKLRYHAHFKFAAKQITWSRLLILIHILKKSLIWIYTVCKGMDIWVQQDQG